MVWFSIYQSLWQFKSIKVTKTKQINSLIDILVLTFAMVNLLCKGYLIHYEDFCPSFWMVNCIHEHAFDCLLTMFLIGFKQTKSMLLPYVIFKLFYRTFLQIFLANCGFVWGWTISIKWSQITKGRTQIFVNGGIWPVCWGAKPNGRFKLSLQIRLWKL